MSCAPVHQLFGSGVPFLRPCCYDVSMKVRPPLSLVHALAVGKVRSFTAQLDELLPTLEDCERQAVLDHLLHLAASFAPPRRVRIFRPASVAIAQVLLERGANVNSRDEKGNTPSILAFCSYNFGQETRTAPTRALLRLFSRYNADFSLGNDTRESGYISPRTLAEERGMGAFIDNLEIDRQTNNLRSRTTISPLSMRQFL